MSALTPIARSRRFSISTSCRRSSCRGKSSPLSSIGCADQSGAGAQRGIEGLRAPLVGRQSELEQIQAAFQTLRNGTGEHLAVVGEAGLGKEPFNCGSIANERSGMGPGSRSFLHRRHELLDGARSSARAFGIKADVTAEKIEHALRSRIEEIAPEKLADIYPCFCRLLEVRFRRLGTSKSNFFPAKHCRNGS